MSAQAPIVRLENGTALLLRLITPEDREAVAEAFRRLSRESRYYRFWSSQQALPDSLLNRFLNAEPGQHESWAALHPEAPDEPGCGGASFWRSEMQPLEAEISLTVADECQHTGVGTVLLAVLWLRARAAGITTLYGHVLADNYSMLDWVRALGAQMQMGRGEYVFRLLLEESLLRASSASTKLRTRLRELEAWGL